MSGLGKNEGRKRETEKEELNSCFLAHSSGLGKRLFRIEKAREKSYSSAPHKRQLTGNAWW